MAVTKEKIESNNAVAEVAKADAKVEQIKAEKAAAKAKKHEETLAKHPKIGKAINWVDDNKWKLVAGAATGGVSFAAGWFGHKFFGKKDAEVAESTVTETSDEVVETPFDA